MKTVLIVIATIVIGALLWWTISPLFIDVEVNDELPDSITVNESSVTATPLPENIVTNEAADMVPAEPPARVPEQARYAIVDTPTHPASGYVRVIETPGEQLIRFEEYDGTNGPDLKIYLAKDLEASEFIDLGPSRGNQGNINYGVPMDVNIDEYPYVLTWCEAFGVLFDYAQIN